MRVASASAAVFLVDGNGRILMQHRDDVPGINNPGCWAVPGGGLEPGEGPQEAARREFREETGYELCDIAFLSSDIVSSLDGTPHSRTFFWSLYDGVQPVECREGQALQFMRLEAAAGLRLSPGVAELLPRAVALAQANFAREVDTPR